MAKEFVHGYRSVLVRNDVKDGLLRFAAEAGFLRESQVERCLASAAIEMVLADGGLRNRLLGAFETASVKDIQAICAARAIASLPSSPSPGTASAACAAANLSSSKEKK